MESDNMVGMVDNTPYLRAKQMMHECMAEADARLKQATKELAIAEERIGMARRDADRLQKAYAVLQGIEEAEKSLVGYDDIRAARGRDNY